MLEYTLEDAKALLQKNLDTAQKNLSQFEHDLDFLRYILQSNWALSQINIYVAKTRFELFLFLQGSVHHY